MEEEKKVPTTSEPSPEGEDEVNASDLDEQDGNSGDSAKEGKGNTNEGKPKEEGSDASQAKKQSRETDAQNAERRRRQKERDEAKQKAREEEIRRQAVFEVKSGQVTKEELDDLGLKKVETEDQLFLVESLRKAKADGVENPQATAYQELFQKQSADKAKADAEAKAQEAEKERRKSVVAQDQANFKAKFGKSTVDVVQNETEFMTLFGSLIDEDKGNFTELYTAYTAMKSNTRDAAKKEGSFPTKSGKQEDPDVEETDEEFKKRYISQYGRW